MTEQNPNPIEAHFDELDAQLRHFFQGAGLAEIHGMASALACQDSGDYNPVDWYPLLGEDAVNSAAGSVIESVFGLSLKCLAADEFEFVPLLPGDDASLIDRIEAVADWCNGFIQGWQTGSAPISGEAAREAIADIHAISEISPDDRDEEQQRFSLFEIEQYIRAAVQLIFDEQAQASKDTQVKH